MAQENLPKKLLEEAKVSILSEFKERKFGQRVLKLWEGTRQFAGNLHNIGKIVKNNYDLGIKHYNLGNFDDARLRLQFVTWLEPKHAYAWYWLGMSQLAVDKKRDAKKSFTKALEIKSDWPEAQQMLEVAKGNAA